MKGENFEILKGIINNMKNNCFSNLDVKTIEVLKGMANNSKNDKETLIYDVKFQAPELTYPFWTKSKYCAYRLEFFLERKNGGYEIPLWNRFKLVECDTMKEYYNIDDIKRIINNIDYYLSQSLF